MSKSLIKLLDSAIIPAAVMICSKVVGLWLINEIFNLTFGLVPSPNTFLGISVTYANESDLLVSASYSNLFMYGSLLIGFTFVLIQALFLHASHISPVTLSKLASNNLLDLVKDSFNIYHEATIWLIFLWSATIIIVANAIMGLSYQWTAIAASTGSLITTVVLLRDVGHEINIARKKIKRGNINLEYK